MEDSIQLLKEYLKDVIENLKEFIQYLLFKWNGLDFNTRLAVGLYSFILFASILYIFLVHIEYSNTGALLWNPRAYKYIDIQPKEDYMNLLKPDGSTPVTKKTIYLDGSSVELSYSVEYEAISILDSMGIMNTLETMKVLEYALKKAKAIMLGKDKKFRYDVVTVIFKKTNELSKFAGAYTERGKMYVNCDFVKAIYGERTKEDFIKYYIGLFIHEFTHMVLYPQYLNATGDIIKISENLCEYVRMVSGYGLNNWYLRKSSKEGPTEKYGPEGAYFVYYIEKNYPGFVNAILLFVEPTVDTSTDTVYNTDSLGDLLFKHTGRTLKDLWASFQNELKSV